MFYFGATGTPVLGTYCLSFKARVGCLIHIAKASAMHVP